MNKQKVIRAMCVLGATLASVPFVFESDLDLPVSASWQARTG